MAANHRSEPDACIDWLLEDSNPSVRYYALRDLLGASPQTRAVREARMAIMERGAVPAILAKQHEGGYWLTPETFYGGNGAKYRGTVWQLLILAELGADSRDERIRAACEFVLRHSQDRESGGFAYRGSAANGGNHSAVIPCLTGNMLFALLRFGYGRDPRSAHAIDWVTQYQRFDDVETHAPNEWPYRFEQCWGRHTCSMGAIKALKALAEIPVSRRTHAVRETLAAGTEYFLIHNVYKRSHDPAQPAKSSWLKFGFPLMYQTDALEILDILTRLGVHDERMNEAFSLVCSKRGDDGRWLLENTFNGRMITSIERKGRPSKWVTLNALRTLKNSGYDAEKGEK